MVNREFARQLFHTGDAVGRYFKNRLGRTIQIVGIVQDGKYLWLSEAPQAAAFYPISQEPDSATSSWAVRGNAEPDGAAPCRKVVGELEARVFRSAIERIESRFVGVFPLRAATLALGLFGAFGLLLSIAGTFGLASYWVSKRLRELSIRVALGGQAREIVSAALGRMLTLMGGGSPAGFVLGVAASRLLSAVVYQASHQGPTRFVCVAAVAATMAGAGLLGAQAEPSSAGRCVDAAKMSSRNRRRIEDVRVFYNPAFAGRAGDRSRRRRGVAGARTPLCVCAVRRRPSSPAPGLLFAV